MNEQHEIKKPTPLLDEKGALAEPGYCKRNLFIYDRAAITAPSLRLKEWDFYEISDGKTMVQVNFADISLGAAATADVIDFSSGKKLSSAKVVLFPRKRFLPLNGDVEHRALYNAHKFGLRVIYLEVQTAENALCAHGLIVLYESYVKTVFLYIALAVCLHKVAAAIAVDGGGYYAKPLYSADILFNLDLCHQYSISLRYLASASCQAGSSLNPFSTSLLLSNLLLKGRAALERPYSAVVTGTTFVL